jgi:hypothetical protein
MGTFQEARHTQYIQFHPHEATGARIVKTICVSCW